MSAARRRGLSSLAVGAALALLLASALPAHAAAPCELKIGAIGPLAGPAAEWGLTLVKSVEMAAAEVNVGGGLPLGATKCHVSVVSCRSRSGAVS